MVFGQGFVTGKGARKILLLIKKEMGTMQLSGIERGVSTGGGEWRKEEFSGGCFNLTGFVTAVLTLGRGDV